MSKSSLFLLAIFCLMFAVQANPSSGTLNDEPIIVGEEYDPDYARNLQSGYQPIRITIDYSGLSNAPTTILNYIQQLVPSAVSYFESALSVIPLSALQIPSTYSTVCGNGNSIPSVYRTGVQTDLVIFVNGNSEQSSYLAYGKSCLLLGTNKRPYVGQILYNFNGLTPGNDFTFESDLLVTMHEIIHLLGFTTSMYQYYPNSEVITKTVNGNPIQVLVVEPLRTTLRQYFNCSTLAGAYLEQQGPATSAVMHFERRVYGYELMTASTIKDARISNLTLTLLASTGWYDVDYSYAEPFFWGKGKGCAFLDSLCITSTYQAAESEFCSPLGEYGCTSTGRFGGYCGALKPTANANLWSTFNYWNNNTALVENFVDNCPYFMAFANTDCQNPEYSSSATISTEFYGLGSHCFMGTLHSSGSISRGSYCFQTECLHQTNGAYYLTIMIGSNSVTCKTAGAKMTVSGYNGDIECPDPNLFCNTIGKPYCKRNCMGNGACNKATGVCTCDEGWRGTDCSIPTSQQQ